MMHYHSLLPSWAVARGGGSAGLTRVATRGGGGVDSVAGVGHLSHKAVGVVSCVGGGLDTAVGEGDRERATNISVGVLGLALLEVGLAVIISHTVLVGVGLGGQLLLDVGLGGRGVLGGGNGHKGDCTQKLKILWYYSC